MIFIIIEGESKKNPVCLQKTESGCFSVSLWRRCQLVGGVMLLCLLLISPHSPPLPHSLYQGPFPTHTTIVPPTHTTIVPPTHSHIPSDHYTLHKVLRPLTKLRETTDVQMPAKLIPFPTPLSGLAFCTQKSVQKCPYEQLFLYPILDTRFANLRPDFVRDHQGTPLGSETGWIGELWSKTNLLNWQN